MSSMAARDVWFLVEKARDAGATRVEATHGSIHVVVTFGPEPDDDDGVVVPLDPAAPGTPYTYPARRAL